jgi:hypothetical protein
MTEAAIIDIPSNFRQILATKQLHTGRTFTASKIEMALMTTDWYDRSSSSGCLTGADATNQSISVNCRALVVAY